MLCTRAYLISNINQLFRRRGSKPTIEIRGMTLNFIEKRTGMDIST